MLLKVKKLRYEKRIKVHVSINTLFIYTLIIFLFVCFFTMKYDLLITASTKTNVFLKSIASLSEEK